MTWSVSRSYEYCTRIARTRARNFYYAFLVLPRAEQRAMCALYAFMRIADDLADEDMPLEAKRHALRAWRSGLDGALSKRYTHPIHPALHDTVRRYAVPAVHLHALLDGVEEDLSGRRYATFSDLYRYCYRVASAVGLACIRIWGYDDPKAEQYAEWSGIAFQLTNILRDVADDARQGRVYLPQDELQKFGCSEQQLLDGPWDSNYRRLMEFQAERARRYYDMAEPLRLHLRPAGRAVFQAMTRIYRALLDGITRRGFEAKPTPVKLTPWRKLALVAQAVPVRLGWM